MDPRTHGPADGPTDKASYRDAWTDLKTGNSSKFKKIHDFSQLLAVYPALFLENPDGPTYEWMDGRKDRRRDGRTDRQSLLLRCLDASKGFIKEGQFVCGARVHL